MIIDGELKDLLDFEWGKLDNGHWARPNWRTDEKLTNAILFTMLIGKSLLTVAYLDKKINQI